MKIIFSADDFGLTDSVNKAVQIAHSAGALEQTSLMVAAPAAADAIARAKAMPALNVGLHLVVVDGDSVLGHARLPHITATDGKFSRNQITLGFLYVFSAAARRELEMEIRAQFAAFCEVGLALHHADAHKHMHLHPTVANMMIRIGKEFGLTRMRVPAEPPNVLKACGETVNMANRALFFWSRVLRRQVRRAGLQSADHVFGINWSGHFTPARLAILLRNLPPGSSEIYFHPATTRDIALVRLMPDYEHVEELQALLSVTSR